MTLSKLPTRVGIDVPRDQGPDKEQGEEREKE
jgi:hypothetical protein